MAQWNNEGTVVDPAMKENFLKTSTFAMIKAEGDTVVVPREGKRVARRQQADDCAVKGLGNE